jgi:serine/threonine protein kinase
MAHDVPSAHHPQVIIPLLRVLEQLHERGIIHRDIKPENIFFEADGSLVLGDFGLAIDSSADKPCSRVGTHDYMAPEVRLLECLLLAVLCVLAPLAPSLSVVISQFVSLLLGG